MISRYLAALLIRLCAQWGNYSLLSGFGGLCLSARCTRNKTSLIMLHWIMSACDWCIGFICTACGIIFYCADELVRFVHTGCRCTACVHLALHERAQKVFERRNRVIPRWKTLIITHTKRQIAHFCSVLFKSYQQGQSFTACLYVFTLIHNAFLVEYKHFERVYYELEMMFWSNLLHISMHHCLMLVICELRLHISATSWNMPERWVCERVAQ